MAKYILWSNRNLDLKDFKKQVKDDPCMYESLKNCSESELIDAMYRYNANDLDFIRDDLDRVVSSAGIIAIADLGLWNGRRQGYKMINSGSLSDCLYSDCDYVEFYVENGKFLATMTHHDGTNYVEFRGVKETVKESTVENLKAYLMDGAASPQMIGASTFKLGDAIGKIYGW
jgi:hypothetical protein